MVSFLIVTYVSNDHFPQLYPSLNVSIDGGDVVKNYEAVVPSRNQKLLIQEFAESERINEIFVIFEHVELLQPVAPDFDLPSLRTGGKLNLVTPFYIGNHPIVQVLLFVKERQLLVKQHSFSLLIYCYKILATVLDEPYLSARVVYLCTYIWKPRILK